MVGRSIARSGYVSDKEEMEEDTPPRKGTRRSLRKSSKVERLQITHSPSPSNQSLTSRRLQNISAPAHTTSLSTGVSTPSTSTKPTTSTPQQPVYTGSYQNYLAQDRYGIGGQGTGGHSGGTNVGLPAPVPTALSSFITWATRGNGLRDIRDADIEDFLTAYWTTTLAVTSHALHRTLPVDSDVFSRSHNDLPWKDQGNIVFLCEGGKLVRAHGVLLNAILPRFVSDLMDIQKLVMVPTYNTSPHLPVFVKGIDARCVEHFLTLSNRSMVFMTGREIMQLKRMIEVLNIHELSVFVAHSGGINSKSLGATDGGNNALTSGTSVVAGPSSAQNNGAGGPGNQLTQTQGISSNLMGSPFTTSPCLRVPQTGQDLAAAKQPSEVRTLFQQEDSGRKVKKGKKKPIYANASAGATSLETSAIDSDVFDLNVSTDKPVSPPSSPLKFRGVSPFVSPSPRAMPPPPPAASSSGGGRKRRIQVVPERKETRPPSPPPIERKRRSTRVKSESSLGKKQQDSSEGDRGDNPERKKRRANYGKGLREAALSAMENGATIPDVSEQFNVDAKTLSRWKYAKKRISSDNNLAVQNQTTMIGPSSVGNIKGAEAALDSLTLNSPEQVGTSSMVQAPLGSVPAPVAETPTIGFDSFLMKDSPIGSYFNGNPNAIYPQAAIHHHSDLITFNNMTMAIQIPPHNQNVTASTHDDRGKENVNTDIIAGTGADPGRNPNLDMPSVVDAGLDLMVDSTNSVELETTN